MIKTVKIVLQGRCSPVNLLHVFRTHFHKIYSGNCLVWELSLCLVTDSLRRLSVEYFTVKVELIFYPVDVLLSICFIIQKCYLEL